MACDQRDCSDDDTGNRRSCRHDRQSELRRCLAAVRSAVSFRNEIVEAPLDMINHPVEPLGQLLVGSLEDVVRVRHRGLRASKSGRRQAAEPSVSGAPLLPDDWCWAVH